MVILIHSITENQSGAKIAEEKFKYSLYKYS